MSLLTNLLASILLIWVYQCHSYHILITATTMSFGNWNQLLHISQELLSRVDTDGNPTNFITFVIDQDHDRYLKTITNQPYNTSSYQIVYTPSIAKINMIKMRDESFRHRMNRFVQSIAGNWFITTPILTSYLSYSEHPKTQHVSSTEMEEILNQNLTHKHNNISSLKFKPVNVCLAGPLHIFAPHLCTAFNIPSIVKHESAVIPMSASYSFWDTYLYYNDIFRFQSYPDLINGTIFKSYSQRLLNVFKQIIGKYVQKLIGRFIIKPKMNELNEKLKTLNKSVDIERYNDGMMAVWSNVALIHSLGPPFSTVFYQRPRIKAYGFLVYPNDNISDLELLEWINRESTHILYISMGSVHLLPENAIQHIYNLTVKHSKDNKYRVLWALRQSIYENVSNKELEREHFKISGWVPQFEVMQHEKIKVFLTHAGGNGIVEGLYSKTPMILYPLKGDQPFNAKRTAELECGVVVNDRETMSDLRTHIETLLIDPMESLRFKKNIENVHNMLLQNGGVKEAADFVEGVGEYGIGHLLCTLGHIYPCEERVIPWYQQTMIDVYVVVILWMMLMVFMLRACCKCTQTQPNKHKTE
eukprot:270638_1